MLEEYYVGFYVTAKAYKRLENIPKHETQEQEQEQNMNKIPSIDNSMIEGDNIIDLFDNIRVPVEEDLLTEQ